MKFATYTAGGNQFFGAVADGGMIALNPVFPQWSGMRDAITAGGLPDMMRAAATHSVSHPDSSFHFDIPVPDPEQIICVGVNFPARNAEYKDGSDLPKYMSLFPRFASGFTVLVLALFIDLTRIAQIGSIATLVLTLAVHWGHLSLRHKTEANPFLLWFAILSNAVIIAGFFYGEITQGDNGTLLLLIGAMVVLYLAEQRLQRQEPPVH